MKELTKEDLNRYRKVNMTVGDLKKFLTDNSIPDDALIMIERVEDFYYENNKWAVYSKKTELGISQYHPAWCAAKYSDEKENLFIDLHY